MNVYCITRNDRVEIFRGNTLIGTVVAIGEDDPVITIFPNVDGVQTLTFNDIAIIQDNWNHLMTVHECPHCGYESTQHNICQDHLDGTWGAICKHCDEAFNLD